MADLTAREKLDRARKSIMISTERLDVINKRLSGLNSELEDLIFINETQGYKSRTVTRTQTEVENLEKEKVTLEKTVSILQGKLSELTRNAMIEETETETVSEYREAYNELNELLRACPSVDVLITALNEIGRYKDTLSATKDRYLTISKKLADVMVKETLPGLGDLTMETLREERFSVDYSQQLELSDRLIDLSEIVNKLQYALFVTVTFNPAQTLLPPALAPEPLISECGRFKIDQTGNVWSGFLKETRFDEGVAINNWKRIYSSHEPVTFDVLKKSQLKR
jgi:hypothetical protein